MALVARSCNSCYCTCCYCYTLKQSGLPSGVFTWSFFTPLGGAASSFGAFSRALGATLPRLRCSASRAPTPSTSRARQAGGKWHHEVQVHGLRVADGPSHRSFQGGLVPPPDQLIGSLPYLLLVTEHQLPPWVVMWPWQVQAMHVLSEHMVAADGG